MVMLTYRESRLFRCRRRVFMLNLYNIIYKQDNVIRIVRNDNILYFCIMLLTPIIDYCPQLVGGCKTTRKKKISRPEGFTFFWGRGGAKKNVGDSGAIRWVRRHRCLSLNAQLNERAHAWHYYSHFPDRNHVAVCGTYSKDFFSSAQRIFRMFWSDGGFRDMGDLRGFAEHLYISGGFFWRSQHILIYISGKNICI